MLVFVSIVPFLLLLSKSLQLHRRLKNYAMAASRFFGFASAGVPSRKVASFMKDNAEEELGQELLDLPEQLLDLPELALEIILGKLSPAGLRTMAGVCCALREKCRSDYLWEKQMREKWGPMIGPAAPLAEWRRRCCRTERGEPPAEAALWRWRLSRWVAPLSCVPPISWLNRSEPPRSGKRPSASADETIMSWYLSLESGAFWFPAQIYNRENGHVGFMLSCYDAEVSYDCHTDTFHAKYPPHGQRTAVVEEGVTWDRIRAPPFDASAHELHVSVCLTDLRPGDHIEIQWRRNKEFPYGWWYGVVGHLQSCDGSSHLCQCHTSDTIILEFNHYTPGSRWRRSEVSRKDHREVGNESDGFYGGIRKLVSKDEISMWKKLWPTEVLE